MNTPPHHVTLTALLVAASTLASCGRSSQPAQTPGDTTSTTSTSEQSSTDAHADAATATDKSESSELQVRDDTADAALETYLNGVKEGKLEIAIAVLHPDAPGTEALAQMMEGWNKAKAAGESATLSLAVAALAGTIDPLKYEKISDDGSFATFRFTSPDQDKPWEIEAIKTPEGWRIKPPDSGLPTG